MVILTIVSITRNDPDGLRKTLKSLVRFLAEAGAAAELIVVDGGNLLDSQINTYRSDLKVRFKKIKQSGQGIYSAMNEGIVASKGDYIWFLNGGDECLISWNALFGVLKNRDEDVLMFDYIYKGPSTDYLRRSRKPRYLWHGLPTSHQAIIFKRGPRFSQIFYSDGLSVAGDYAFVASYYKAGATFWVEHVVLSAFDGGGLSLRKSEEISREALLVQKIVLGNGAILRQVSKILHGLSRYRRKTRQRRQ